MSGKRRMARTREGPVLPLSLLESACTHLLILNPRRLERILHRLHLRLNRLDALIQSRRRLTLPAARHHPTSIVAAAAAQAARVRRTSAAERGATTIAAGPHDTLSDEKRRLHRSGILTLLPTTILAIAMRTALRRHWRVRRVAAAASLPQRHKLRLHRLDRRLCRRRLRLCRPHLLLEPLLSL